jgi:uncharacterized protein (UPF0218 family)
MKVLPQKIRTQTVADSVTKKIRSNEMLPTVEIEDSNTMRVLNETT